MIEEIVGDEPAAIERAVTVVIPAYNEVQRYESLRTIVFFNPLKVFIPLGAVLFATAH